MTRFFWTDGLWTAEFTALAVAVGIVFLVLVVILARNWRYGRTPRAYGLPLAHRAGTRKRARHRATRHAGKIPI